MSVEVRGLNEVINKLHFMIRNLAPQLAPTLDEELKDVVNYIRSSKLSGQVLNIKTGALYNSIGSYVSTHGARLSGQVYSRGVAYAGIHEFGGLTQAHVIAGSPLHFFMNGIEMFAMSVNHPGSRMPERSFLRSGVSDKLAEIKLSLSTATARLMKK